MRNEKFSPSGLEQVSAVAFDQRYCTLQQLTGLLRDDLQCTTAGQRKKKIFGELAGAKRELQSLAGLLLENSEPQVRAAVRNIWK